MLAHVPLLSNELPSSTIVIVIAIFGVMLKLYVTRCLTFQFSIGALPLQEFLYEKDKPSRGHNRL